jgi:hypothetical protein
MPRLLAICALCLAAAGCAVEQVHDDQDKLRCALLDLYTDQLVDNLVRAVNGMPIIHLDYGTAQAQILAKDSAMVGDSYSNTVTHMLTTAATTTLMTTRSAVNTLMGNASRDNTETIAVTATPLTNSVEAYNAYLQFLALPGSLQSSSSPPPPNAALVCRRYGDVYFWVPTAFKDTFYNLGLATIADRGRLLVPPPKFYTISLRKVIKPVGTEGGLLLEFTPSIPNDVGYIVFSNNNRANVAEYDPGNGVRLFETDKLVLYFNPAALPLGMKSTADLDPILQQGQIQVNAYLKHHRPGPPTTSQLLDMIPFNSQEIKWDVSPEKPTQHGGFWSD